MEFTINGFGAEQKKNNVPKKSLVQVQFPDKGMTLTYYNDQFDLHIGDRVYVEGKLEGQLGRVMDITYSFKIKLSDYKKVIAVVDTNVHGEFHMAGSHFVTFDPAALPKEQIATWFNAPMNEDNADTVFSYDEEAHFPLDDLSKMKITQVIAERGHKYYLENRVRYICLDRGIGYAIVEGSENYTVEFEYCDGNISRLLCDCPCAFNCKHEFAAMLQLRETLELIEKHYSEAYARSGYFAAVCKGTLFSIAIDGKETGSFTL